MDTIRQPQSVPRRRRWTLALSLCAVLLAVYAGGLTWLSQRLETDVAKAIKPLSMVVQDQQRGD